LFQTFSKTKVYNALAVLILLYGSDTWTLRKKDKKRLTSIDIKFFKATTGYNFLTTKKRRNFGRVESSTS
jgi:hypothetical protein